MTRQLTPQRILVVDDEAPMRKFLSSNLNVLSAADGVDALKLFEEHRFDLLLLDINIWLGQTGSRSSRRCGATLRRRS